MLHVSFAMTSDAYADRSKTETRRFWKPAHAAKFKPGTVFMGTTKDFGAGGTRIHPARVVFVRRERLGDMTEESFRREGGTRYWPSREDYIFAMGGADLVPFVIRFEHLEEFLRFYRHAVISREIFEIEKKKDPSTLTDIQRAARYYYLQRLAFGGKTVDRTFGTSALGAPRLNIANIEETLLEVHWRLKRVTIENLPALECISRYDRPSTFFYLDPPYWETAGYAVPFGPADYDALARTLSGIQGRFLLSLNDVPDVRRIFGRFQIRTVKTGYTVANGRGGGGRAAERTEVLISGPAARRSTVAVPAVRRKSLASKSLTLGSETAS